LGFEREIYFRFADYDGKGKKHVFVVVRNIDGSEIWIDPTPIIDDYGYYTKRSFDDRIAIPIKYTDKKINSMSLKTMSGLNPYGGSVGIIGPTTTTPTTTQQPTTLQQVATTDPQLGAFVQSAMNIIDQLPEGGIKNFLKDYLKNPVTAFQRLYFGKPFTSGAYHLGEVYMRAILGDATIQNRGMVPDAVVPQACEFFTVALGVRVVSEDHIEQLAISPDAYYAWMKQDAGDVPRANVDRAHQILKDIDYPKNQSDGRRNNKWSLAVFEKYPYSYPLVGTTVGSLFNGTNPVNNIKLINGYPAGTVAVNPDGTPGTPAQAGIGGSLLGKVIIAGGIGYLLYTLLTRKKQTSKS